MKKAIIVAIFFVALVALSGCTGTGDKPISSEKTTGLTKTEKVETKENAKAELISTHWEAYTDSIDTNWAIVTGVVKNTGEVTVELDRASGSIYDADGKVVGNSTEMFSPDVIAPGEEAYVAVSISDTAKKEDIVDSKIQFSFDETSDKPAKINAINDTGKLTDYDYVVTGELENSSDERIEDGRVAVLFYDKEGALINVEKGYPKPDTIPPHDAVSYKVSNSHLENLVDSYKVIGFVF